jgi:hypothetical protein
MLHVPVQLHSIELDFFCEKYFFLKEWRERESVVSFFIALILNKFELFFLVIY